MGIEKKTELNFESVVSGLPSTTTASAVPITTKQLTEQTIGGEDTYDVITVSPSSSSDGSGNEFVKVEHSDVQQSVGDTLPFRMVHMHSDGDDKRGRDRRYPVGSIMDRGLGSDEPYGDVLLRSEEFAESEKVSDIAKTGEREVMDVTNKAVNTKVSREALDDTVHVLGDKVKEMVGRAGDMGQETMETAGDTVSNMFSRKVHDIASAAQEADSVNEDVRYSLDEGAVHTFNGKFDDVTREILDSTHHATNTLTNTLQKADVTGDALKGVAAQAVPSVEDILADLDDKIKSSASYAGDSHARTESIGAAKIGNEDLIRLTDGSNNASQHDTGSRTVFPQPTHDENQHVGYPSSQQWGLDWRQYADEAAGIGLRHFDREAEADVKAVHSADDSSAEESMFDRKGPLTIPHQSPEDTIQLDRDFNSSKQSGFEVSPRPPTPPKELDDEDVKPTTIDLGQTADPALLKTFIIFRIT
uniref:Uncharacterized protein n=1 Tax=Wuchereria bancrofti TaxID=6293 RepID=A0A1I8EQI5_WUCBA